MTGKCSSLLLLFVLLAGMMAACGGTQPDATSVPPMPTKEQVEPTKEQVEPTQAPPEPTQPPEETATVEPEVESDPLYLAIIWHQHQPIYFKDPETGIYQKPWVRLHAAKDYVDMAAILEEYPDIQATFNLTPSLLRQVLDLEEGAVDLYQVHTEIPAAELTDEQKAFIRDRFFDINPKIIARFPRYQEIANDRVNWDGWGEETWRDLQVLFNLCWTDPAWLAQEPLASLMDQGRGYSEQDKAVVLAEHERLVAEVIPVHQRLQAEGRIELTMTPFFHPILPLLLDSNLARVAVPDIELPPRYTYGLDAIAQVQMGVDFYTETFGQPPQGMWPAEGAVAQGIVDMVAMAGLQWMASDEEVLARSLGETAFARDSTEVVQNADALYRPYIVSSQNRQMYIVFRDKVISDKVNFAYSGTPGSDAAMDFVNRIRNIRTELEDSGAEGPHLVSVILDGENAWEHYPNDGKEFLHTLYDLLQEEQEAGIIQTITPGAFVAQFPDQPALEELWAGSWVSPDYLTWIGEDEENRAWDYLGQVRGLVELRKSRLDEDTLAAVMDTVYSAEGSDWFWWYGADQNSGDDGSFDDQFRRTLQRVYEIMGEPVPAFLKVPIIPATPQAPEAAASALIAPEIDGMGGEEEWLGAGYYLEEGGAQATPSQVVSKLWYGFDAENLYLRLDGRRPWMDLGDETYIGFYLTRPVGGDESPFSRIGGEDTLLGFGAQALVEVTVHPDEVGATFYLVDGSGVYTETPTAVAVGVSGSTLELAIAYAGFGKPDAGDTFKLRVAVSEGEQRDIQVVPGGGPGALVVPDLGLTTPILTVVDPEEDDYGPGSYLYPLDGVFSARSYDLAEFAVAEDDSNIIFRFSFYGPLNNAWGAGNGMGIHLLDMYVDAGEGGARKLLPGRKAAVPEGQEWDFAIAAEGWPQNRGLFAPPTTDSPQPVKFGSDETLSITSDAGQHKITVRVPKDVLAELLGIGLEDLEPRQWGYLAIVLSQDDPGGIWGARQVGKEAAQWLLGGAPEGTNHSSIIDVAYPAGFTPTQEEALSSYPASQETNMDALGPDDFAQLPMVRPE